MAVAGQPITIEGEQGPLDGLWIDRPTCRTVLLLGHGAGAGMQAPLLAGFSTAVAELGVATLRFDFPYMRDGRRAPDRTPVLVAAFRAARAEALDRAAGRPLFAGGRSMGGRIASMMAAEGDAVAGLVFLAYPLHPPGKPERIRDAHLYRITVPMLFLQGSNDPFARADLLGDVLRRLGDRARYVPVPGGDHSFRVRGGPNDPAEIGAGLAPAATAFIDDCVRS